MHFNHSCPLKVFSIHLTVIVLSYLAYGSVSFLVFGQLLHEVNLLAWCLPITESLAPLLWRVSPLYLCFVMQR